MPQRVLVDSNVAASRTLMDWLFNLKRFNNGLFSLIWTRGIQAEALREG